MRVLFARVDTQVAATWGMWRTGVVMAAVGLLGFQAFHVLEHGIQIGYWFGHPQAAPFLTPWAVVGRDVLAAPLGRGPAGGAELLHLVGNLLFLGGLLLLAAVWRYDGRSAGLRTEYGVRRLRWATWAQVLHVGEHVLLTTTFLFAGSANGLSTGFGALPAGPVGGAVRVWVHFALNAIPTVLVGVALYRGWTAAQRTSPAGVGREAPLLEPVG